MKKLNFFYDRYRKTLTTTNGLILTPLDLNKVVDTELYNESLKLIEEQK
jgi:hypothetical protein